MTREPRARATGGLLMALAAATAVGAQSPSPPPTQPAPQFRGGVDVVVVEATVVDRREDVVRGLGPADFTAEVDGRRREIVSAEFVEYAPPSPDAPGGDVEITTNEPLERGRTVLLMVDQTGLRPESRGVVDAAQRWVRSLGPQDRVGLIVFPRGGARIEFTTDHDRVADELSRVVGSDVPPPPFSHYNVSLWEAARIASEDAFVTGEVVERECRRGAAADPYCPRNIEIRARTMIFDAKAQAYPVLEALRSLVEGLGATPGPKHAVLISPGWGLIEKEAAVEIGHVAAAAARANVIVHTLTAEEWALAASRGKPQTTPMQDQMLLLNNVEMVSGMTGGRAVRLTASHDAAFTQLNGGLSGYYRLGIRAVPEDLDGRQRRITLKVTRAGAQLASYRRVFVGAPPAPETSGEPEAVLRDALKNGTPLSALGLRATSYVLHGASGTRDVRVVVAGDVLRAAPGKAKVVAALYELEGRPVEAREATIDVPASGEAAISLSMDAPPGSYGLRLAVLDAGGRAGSLERLVDARWKKAGRVQTPGLVLFHARPGAGAPLPVFDGVEPADDLVVQLALAGGAIAGTQVAFEVRASGSQAPLLSRRARIAQTTSGQTVAHDTLPAALVPPGRYVLSARIGDTTLSRAFIVRRGSEPMPSIAPLVARPPFDLAAVFDPAVVDPTLGRLADRLPLKATFEAALRQLRQGDLDPAADALHGMQQAVPDFAPALVYLGACYAAGGRDRDATSAWQRALALEPSPLAQRLAIEAWLRAGVPVSAQALVTQARERWPADPAFARLQAQVTLAEGKAPDGLAQVAALAEPDPQTLLLALATLYDAARRGMPIQDAAGDRETMRRLRDRYAAMHGDALGLVDAWMRDADSGSHR